MMRRAASAGLASTVSPGCGAADASVSARSRSRAVAPGGGARTRGTRAIRPNHNRGSVAARHQRGAVRQHFGGLGGERGSQRSPAQAGDRAFDRQHGRAGDTQHLAPAAVEPAGDPQRIAELDADQTERLLAAQSCREERGNAAGAAVGRVVAAPHRGAVGDDGRRAHRPPMRCPCRRVHRRGSPS